MAARRSGFSRSRSNAARRLSAPVPDELAAQRGKILHVRPEDNRHSHGDRFGGVLPAFGAEAFSHENHRRAGIPVAKLAGRVHDQEVRRFGGSRLCAQRDFQAGFFKLRGHSRSTLKMARDQNQEQVRVFLSQFEKDSGKQRLLSLECAPTQQDRRFVGHAQGAENRTEISRGPAFCGALVKLDAAGDHQAVPLDPEGGPAADVLRFLQAEHFQLVEDRSGDPAGRLETALGPRRQAGVDQDDFCPRLARLADNVRPDLRLDQDQHLRADRPHRPPGREEKIERVVNRFQPRALCARGQLETRRGGGREDE